MSSNRKNRSFKEMQHKWAEDETDLAMERGFVPSAIYFLVGPGNVIVGCLSYRQDPNERLRLNGGNIGYGIRRSMRSMGPCPSLGTPVTKTPREQF